METIEKVWGREEVLVNNDKYCSKFLHVSPGKQCSLHYHILKDETFIVMQGDCLLTFKRGEFTTARLMYKGESFHVKPGLPHRFGSKDGCTILEISTPHSDADVVRLEPSGDYCS